MSVLGKGFKHGVYLSSIMIPYGMAMALAYTQLHKSAITTEALVPPITYYLIFFIDSLSPSTHLSMFMINDRMDDKTYVTTCNNIKYGST